MTQAQTKPALPYDAAKAIVEWCKANPIMIYADWRDEVPDKVAEAMIASGSLDELDEFLWEYEINYLDHVDTAQEALDQMHADRVIDLSEMSHEQIQEARDIVHERRAIDSSDVLRIALGNSHPKLAVTVLDDDGESYEFPQGYDCDEEENEHRVERLKGIGVVDPWAAEATYSYDALKVIGTIDMRWLYESLASRSDSDPSPLSRIRIGKLGMAIAHNSWNGSGGCGDVTISGVSEHPCSVRLDSSDRYGVDAVFGLVGSCWSDELDFCG